MNIDRVAALVSSTAVIIVVFAAFLMIGTPEEQRLRRLDAERVSDLQRLARAVDDYYHDHGELPASLEALVDGRRLHRLPVDPTRGDSYGFEAAGNGSYRLCASFDSASEPEPVATFWAHSAGPSCFRFEAESGAAETGARGPGRG